MKKTLLSLSLSLMATAQAATEIEWWHAMNGASLNTVNKIAKQFNESQDQYVVNPVLKGNYNETMTSVISAYRANQQPAIAQIYEDGTAMMMAAKGVTIPVEDIMNEYGDGIDKSAFFPIILSYYKTADDKMLSLPFNHSTPILWYNKDAFKKAGVTQVPRTWTEMDAVGNQLRAAGYSCGYTIAYPSWILIDNYGAWNNVSVAERSGKDKNMVTKMTVDNPVLTDRLQAIKDSGNFVYGGRGGDSLPLFFNETCPMWVNASAYYGYISQNAPFEVGMAKMPYDDKATDKHYSSTLGGATLWVMNGHSDEEYKATAAFLSFLTKPEIQSIWHQETGNVPVSMASYELSQQQGYYKEHPGTEIAVEQIGFEKPSENTRSIRFVSFLQDRSIFEAELENIWSGKKTAAEAMKTANDIVNPHIKRDE